MSQIEVPKIHPVVVTGLPGVIGASKLTVALVLTPAPSEEGVVRQIHVISNVVRKPV